MTYDYKILPSSLHPTADAAIKWFRENWGIKSSTIQAEAPIHRDVSFRPTFVAHTNDFHILCIEVAETIYTPTLDSFVLDCQKKGLPVKAFVAVSKGFQEQDYAKKLKAAKRAGVGLLEVDDHSGELVQNALSLSVSGVRAIQVTDFPARYREVLQQAEQNFRDGQPAKACAVVYDELEAAFRRFAEKCYKKKYWKNPHNLDIKKAPWANIIVDLDRRLDRNQEGTRNLPPAFMARILGITGHRNDSGHKPANQLALTRRDMELRTRFEAAVDLLRDFLAATSAFRV